VNHQHLRRCARRRVGDLCCEKASVLRGITTALADAPATNADIGAKERTELAALVDRLRALAHDLLEYGAHLAVCESPGGLQVEIPTPPKSDDASVLSEGEVKALLAAL